MNNSDEPLYVNLKVLSQLQPFQKINTRAALFKISNTEPNTVVQYIPEFIQRWWSGSSRESDFLRIKDLYSTARENMENEKKRETLIKHLIESKRGLLILQKTYENDVTFKARIDNLMEVIDEIVNS